MESLAIPLIAFAAVAAGFDLRTRRIPNALTLGGFLLALAIRGLGGGQTLLQGVAGAGLALLVTLPLFATGGFGGGDVKFLMAVGAFLSPGRLLVALFSTAVIGGVMGLVMSAKQRALGSTFSGMGRVVRGVWLFVRTGGHTRAFPTLSTPGAVTIPYGLAIAGGALAGLLV